MRDLEIRGAGNLLGTGQSGHIAAVGYDLYVEMVTQAIAELSGEPVRIPAEIKLDLPVDAHLPDDYVAQEDLRIEAYRRLATVTTQAEVDDITAEWIDRFGAIPDPARALLAVARVRAECARIGITECTATRNPDFDGPPLRAVLAPVELLAACSPARCTSRRPPPRAPRGWAALSCRCRCDPGWNLPRTCAPCLPTCGRRTGPIRLRYPTLRRRAGARASSGLGHPLRPVVGPPRRPRIRQRSPRPTNVPPGWRRDGPVEPGASRAELSWAPSQG